MGDQGERSVSSERSRRATSSYLWAWPFVGRDDLVAEVVSLASRLNSVLIVGAVGVGKTRLAREALPRLGGPVLVAVANQSASRIPFGAVAHLLPATLPTAEQRSNVLRVLAEALVASAPAGRPVLFADDVHLLDDDSAALLLHLVVRGDVRIILTARSGEPVPDAVGALLRGGYAGRVQVPPLAADAAGCLLERVLGGQVQTATVQQLWQRSGGNVLWLQQLVDAGLAGGALAPAGEVWRWQGPFQLSAQLVDLVGQRIGRLAPTARRAAELLALGEPLGVSIVEQLTSIAAVDELDHRQLILSDDNGRRVQVRLAHPLYGEVLRRQTPPHRRRRYCRELAIAVQATGMRRRGDVTRVAAWLLETGDPLDPQFLLTAADHAIRARDFALAARLARAACEAGGGPPARRALANALSYSGDGAQAEQLNTGLPPAVTADPDQLRSVQLRAATLYLSLDRPTDALDLLHRTEKEITVGTVQAELAAWQAIMHAAQADWPAYTEAVTRARHHHPASPYITVLTRYAECIDHFGHARTAAAIRSAEAGLSLPCGAVDIPLIRVGLLAWLCTAQAYAGRLDDAEAVATAGYTQAQADQWAGSQGAWQLFLGRIAARRGRLHTARRHLRDASTTLRDDPTWGQYALLLGEWATTEAMIGDHSTAQALLDQAHLARVESNRMLHILSFQLAHPWILAARGHTRDAVRHALDIADQARRQETLLWEAELLHLPVRLNRSAPVTARLTRLAAITDAPHIDTYAAHTVAFTARDPAAMEDVCTAYDAAGMRLHAAEAAAHANHLWSRRGNAIRAHQAADRCHQLLEQCDHVTTPAILACSTSQLTPRERHIAHLAATGHTSQHIADTLGIAARTVDNHLYRIYRKTGINNRTELHRILAINP